MLRAAPSYFAALSPKLQKYALDFEALAPGWAKSCSASTNDLGVPQGFKEFVETHGAKFEKTEPGELNAI